MSLLPSLTDTAISSRNNSSFIAAQANRIRSPEPKFAWEKIEVFVRSWLLLTGHRRDNFHRASSWTSGNNLKFHSLLYFSKPAPPRINTFCSEIGYYLHCSLQKVSQQVQHKANKELGSGTEDLYTWCKKLVHGQPMQERVVCSASREEMGWRKVPCLRRSKGGWVASDWAFVYQGIVAFQEFA